MARFTALLVIMAAVAGCSSLPAWTVKLTSETGHGKEDAPRITHMLNKLWGAKLVSADEHHVVLRVRAKAVDRAVLEEILVPHSLGFHFAVADQAPLRPAKAGMQEPAGARAEDVGGLGLVWLAETCASLEPLGAKAAISPDQRASCICEDYLPPPRQCRLLLLERDPFLTGSSLTEARAEFDANDTAIVMVTFDDDGRRVFAERTRSGIGRFIAVVLDGRALIAPRVHEPIEQGRVRITLGTRGKDAEAQIREAQRLATAFMVTMLEGRWTIDDVVRDER